MSLSLNRIQDPRDKLEKARRKELEKFAKANGVTEVKPGMPAPIMRKILRQRGLTDINIPRHRYLGGPSDMATQGRPVMPDPPMQKSKETVDAASLLEKEWDKPDYSTMGISELRAECKKKGIKLKRTDKMLDMVRKLNGEDAP